MPKNSRSAVSPQAKKQEELKNCIFLSWSGPLSQKVAKAFEREFEKESIRPPNVKGLFYLSETHTGMDEEWHPNVIRHLEAARCIIVFLTKSNIRSLGWTMFEVGWVRGKGNPVIPVFVDFNPREMSQSDPIRRRLNNSPLGGHYVGTEAVASPSLVDQVFEVLIKHGLVRSGVPVMDEYRDLYRPCFLAKWQSALEEEASAEVINHLPATEPDLDAWFDQLHHVVHFGRDAAVHSLNDCFTSGDVLSILKRMLPACPEARKEGKEKAKPAAMFESNGPVAELLKDILERVTNVFKGTLSPADSKNLRVCFRDLRSDGSYHTSIRRTPDGADYDGEMISRPWPGVHDILPQRRASPEPAVGLLWQKVQFLEGGQKIGTPKCVLNCETAEIPFVSDGNPHKPQSMLIGAILLKEKHSASTRFRQAALCGLLCVSAAQPKAFGRVHERLLQACNDMLSSVFNALVRANDIKGVIGSLQGRVQELENKLARAAKTSRKN